MRSMDYAEARAAFFQPRDAAAGQGDADRADASAGRRLRHAIEPIATIHYWSEPASQAYAAVGLDFLGGYVWSRACVLGEPDGGVVAAAFGVFEPGLISTVYDAARGSASLEQVRAARTEGARNALVATLGAPDGLAEVVAALRRGAGAAAPTARPFTAGLLGLRWPDDDLLGLWHVTNVLREYRGDCHLAACVTQGLSGLQANVLTELQVGWEPGSYTATRGWSAPPPPARAAPPPRGYLADGGTLSAMGAELRAEIEDITEALMSPVIGAIGTDLEQVLRSTTAWSQQIIDRGWFPPDPYKRASG